MRTETNERRRQRGTETVFVCLLCLLPCVEIAHREREDDIILVGVWRPRFPTYNILIRTALELPPRRHHPQQTTIPTYIAAINFSNRPKYPSLTPTADTSQSFSWALDAAILL